MTSTIPNRAADLDRRVAELEAELERESTRARNQAALYKIAALASSADEMQTFYEGIHAILRELVYAENIYVALYDEERRRINFPYAVDSVDKDWPDPREWQALGDRDTKGATGYILRTGHPLRSRAEIERLLEAGELEPTGPPPVDFLGVPLRTEGHTIGVLTVQSYVEGKTYSRADEELMVFVADHIAAALARTRSDTELRQRNAELAIVNEVGQALAKQLDLAAITELVGARLHETFPDTDLFVALYDAKTNLISFPYEIGGGKRYHTDPIPADGGLTAKVIHSREPLLVRTGEEAAALGAIVGKAMSQSWLGVPIIAGDELIGVLAVESEAKPYAFDESDARLLSTLGASTGVALRNARLFDETKSLLGESEQRTSELSIINEIGSALAEQLDFQAIIDLVGDRLVEMFRTRNFYIGLYDRSANLISFPYEIDEGRRVHSEPMAFGQGVTSRVIGERRSYRLASYAEQHALGGLTATYVEDDVSEIPTQSWLGVPIMAGREAIGVVVLGDLQPNKYGEADERLVATIASSMGVALENARLFDETKRLLTETEQRNAELAVINEIGAALGKQLDFQAIVDAVGDRLADVLSSRNLYVAILDERTKVISFPYSIENGLRDHMPNIPMGEGLTSRVLTSGRSVRLGTVADAEALGVVWFGEVQESYLGVPILAGKRVIGVLSVSKAEPNAFSEADEQLVSTVASSMGVALENARLFDETTARAAELAIINSVQEGLVAQLDMQAMYELVGNKIVEIFHADTVDIATIEPAEGLIRFQFGLERGERLHVETIPLVGFRKRVYETKAPIVVNRDMADRAVEVGNPLVIQGQMPKSAVWLPLFGGGEVTGVLSLQTLDREDAYGDAAVRLLGTLASSLGVALENARLFDETKRLLAETEQRNAELAVINEIGEALAKQLDFQGIIDAVGDRIRAIFDVTSGGISLYDSRTSILSMPYSIDQGQRMYPADRPLGGLAKVVIEKRSPLRLGTNAESDALGAYVFGTDDSESWLGVPILTGDRVLGTISLERLLKNAFSESDERLLATIASNLGVALENARLFDETKRLLTETDERAAELAIINSVQEGLAAKLDMQAMYDLVGDKITEIFDVDGVDIERYDATTGTVTFEYTVERGERLPADPISLIGFRRQVVESRAAVLINRDLPARAAEAGQSATIAGELAKSALFVPMITGGAVTGIVLIENLEHEDAFSERDVRLLTTIAGSLGVALENARLFDETQRLLAETNERAAELAIINSVQQGLAAELDMQAMYELVGDKIQEIFDAQIVDIALQDADSGLMQFRYGYERGERQDQTDLPLVGFRKQAMEKRKPVVVNDRMHGTRPSLGPPVSVLCG